MCGGVQSAECATSRGERQRDVSRAAIYWIFGFTDYRYAYPAHEVCGRAMVEPWVESC